MLLDPKTFFEPKSFSDTTDFWAKCCSQEQNMFKIKIFLDLRGPTFYFAFENFGKTKKFLLPLFVLG